MSRTKLQTACCIKQLPADRQINVPTQVIYIAY